MTVTINNKKYLTEGGPGSGRYPAGSGRAIGGPGLTKGGVPKGSGLRPKDFVKRRVIPLTPKADKTSNQLTFGKIVSKPERTEYRKITRQASSVGKRFGGGRWNQKAYAKAVRSGKIDITNLLRKPK